MQTLKTIRQAIKADLHAVDQAIEQHLAEHPNFVQTLSNHLLQSGGKRLRPVVVILGAKACEYQGSDHITLAAAIEFFHTATLLHDDVVDGSDLRRGQETANHIWGSQASVLVGDFLFTHAFKMMVSVQHLHVIKVLSEAANTIAKGEVLQLINCNDPSMQEAQYMEIISNKTAALFSAAAQLGAILQQQPDTIIQALAQYGLHIGIAFQLVDDALDYCADAHAFGKNLGNDLAEGKPTLPLIHALQHANAVDRKQLMRAIEQGHTENSEAIQAILQSTQSIDYTYQVAREQVDKALSALNPLPGSLYKKALHYVADFALTREY